MGMEVLMNEDNKFRYLELVIQHCKTFYKASCTAEAFAKGRMMNWIDFRGDITNAGRDLAYLMENEPFIYRKAYDISFEWQD